MGPQVERRQFGRRQTGYTAWILVPGRPKIAACLVNISPKGALLEMEKPPWLPVRFALLIGGHGGPVNCELRHVTAHGVGVLFTSDCSRAYVEPRTGAHTCADEWIGPPAAIVHRGN